MLKKQITYTDFNGQSVTEEFHFHLSKADLAEMQMTEIGGMNGLLTRLLAEGDQKKTMAVFKGIIALSVGQREGDRRFRKSEDITAEFMESDAYSVLFMELFENVGNLAAFFRGIVPADLAAQVPVMNTVEDVEKLLAERVAPTEDDPTLVDIPVPLPITDKTHTFEPAKKIHEYTLDELGSMPYDAFKELFDGGIMSTYPRELMILGLQRKNTANG